MQPLTPRKSLRRLASPGLLGVGALLMAVVLVVTAAVLHTNPPNQQTVAFYTTDAAMIRPGDSVRIAGVGVGRIKSLAIEPDRVKVTAHLDRDAFVGDRSQVQVRMRTVAGGYYTSITSLGDDPLGDKVIPLERVSMPYNLVQTVTEATDLTDRITTAPIRESLNRLQDGLSGHNAEALSALMDAGNSLTAVIDEQRGQLSSILAVSDEYIAALRGHTEALTALLRKVSIIEQTLVLYSAGFGQALAGMGDLLASVGPLARFYMGHREKFIEKVRNWQEIVQTWADRSGLVVRGLRRVRDKLERVLDAQNAGPDLLATDLCIPVPGSAC